MILISYFGPVCSNGGKGESHKYAENNFISLDFFKGLYRYNIVCYKMPNVFLLLFYESIIFKLNTRIRMCNNFKIYFSVYKKKSRIRKFSCFPYAFSFSLFLRENSVTENAFPVSSKVKETNKQTDRQRGNDVCKICLF